jgi:hypothetical protein
MRMRKHVNVCQVSYVNFESPADVFIEFDGAAVGTLHVIGNSPSNDPRQNGREIVVKNGGVLADLTGVPRRAIEIMNGTGKSSLHRADISTLVDPPVVGDGEYSLDYGNRYLSRSGLYEKGPPRAQGQLEGLVKDPKLPDRAYNVAKSTAFYTTGETEIAWLGDTFATHLISIVCADGSLTLDHNVPGSPPGYKPISLAGGTTFHGGPGSIITLQNTYAGWRETARIAGERTIFEWQPGGGKGLAVGAGDTSPAVGLPGAGFGDFVRVGAPYDLQGAIVAGYVVGPDRVAIRVQNLTPASLVFGPGRWVVATDR